MVVFLMRVSAYDSNSKWSGATFGLTFTCGFELWSKKALVFIAKVSRGHISAYYSSVCWIPIEKHVVFITKSRGSFPATKGAG